MTGYAITRFDVIGVTDDKVRRLIEGWGRVRGEGSGRGRSLSRRQNKLEAGTREREAVIEGLEKKHVSLVEEARAVEEKERVKSRASKVRSRINGVSEVAQGRIEDLRFQIEKLTDLEVEMFMQG